MHVIARRKTAFYYYPRATAIPFCTTHAFVIHTTRDHAALIVMCVCAFIHAASFHFK